MIFACMLESSLKIDRKAGYNIYIFLDISMLSIRLVNLQRII